MKPKHRVGETLIVVGLLLIIFSGIIVSFFGTKTVDAISGKDYWMRMTKTIPPHVASEWTRAIIGSGIVICAFGVWFLFRRTETEAD
jgi:branched-subunit amino acid ABC-type transport system permease component